MDYFLVWHHHEENPTWRQIRGPCGGAGGARPAPRSAAIEVFLLPLYYSCEWARTGPRPMGPVLLLRHVSAVLTTMPLQEKKSKYLPTMSFYNNTTAGKTSDFFSKHIFLSE